MRGDHWRGEAPTLLVTADDFGASRAVNEAVERGHRHGILTCASLMVAGDAAADAVARAKALPGLGVGLHLVLVEGRPTLPARDVPDLVDGAARFRTNMALAGVNFLRPQVRRQLDAEIGAQFDAFAATGLALDHVNAHKHFHLHPMVAALILKHGRRHGLRAARAPVEPLALLRAVEPVHVGLAGRIAAPYARSVARRFRRAGLAVPDRVLGLAWSGHMTPARVARLIDALPPGVTELYLHPATVDDWPGHAPGYDYRGELAALVGGDVREAVGRRGARLAHFAELGGRE
ncbi:hopanoid biosynthesis-associated protein HpnK [Sphingomonas sp.]|uniref:hopanoid biosynthesis-associated protein HpnK n=1 Tax=Sphingomonas sp. TaxID=28214 RepID=UPI003B0073BF